MAPCVLSLPQFLLVLCQCRPEGVCPVLSLSHKIAQADTHLALGLAKAALSSRGERALSRGRTPDWTRRPPDWTPAKSQGASLKR